MGLAGIFGALGLSGAAGLNAYIPLMVVAVLGRLDVIHLQAPYDLLTRTWALAIIGVLLVIELVVDKVPGADHVNDVVQTFVRPTAGAVLFAANAGVVTDVHPAVSLVCGLIIAFGVHATKAAARPVVNTATVGAGAPVVSIVEDVASLATSLVAVFLPILVVVLAILFAVAIYWVWSRRRKKKRERLAHAGVASD